VATKKDVESKLRALIQRLEDAGNEARGTLTRALPVARRIQMDVPDLDASYWTELEAGKLGPLHTGAASDPDIRLTAKSDDLIAMIDGKRNLFTAYLAGDIRVKASVSDLMALRRLL
jgi:predicted lipid carrier protein YhbT